MIAEIPKKRCGVADASGKINQGIGNMHHAGGGLGLARDAYWPKTLGLKKEKAI